ncbi:MAG: sugar phosphate isomerase/epimerase [Bacteroidales bacterium]|nr:sugar phosphate isomerase/epimerase [Bacteroidales bacterium]
MTTRREFIRTAGMAAGSAALIGAVPFGLPGCNKRSLSFGFQTWTLRDQLGEDLPGTLKMMAEKGYSEVEFCSPLGYKGTPFEKFNDMTGKELRKIIEDAGLVCESSHYNMGELREHLDNRIEWSQEMGITQIVASSFWLPKDASMDDYREACQELNMIGEKTKSAGIQAGFHNHHMEFEKIDGKLIYDVLLEELDPELVKMQFQVAVVNIGYQAADYFRKHPGRFISAHLADWSDEKQTQVPIGQGIVDWPDFFEAAETGGVKNFFVEMAPDTFTESAVYLKTI